MFSIFNGRTSFYQWDVDQKLIINCDIPDYQVHFKNTSDEVCYTLEPYEMDGKTVVNVPNVLLQKSAPIVVWCYVLDKNGNYTIKSKTFAVIERQKPSDYVYTETEVLSFNSKLDKNVGAENAGKALIVGEDGNIVFEDTNKNSDAVLYTAQNLTEAQQKQARENIDVAGYNVVNCLWPTEHSGREDTDITTLLDSGVYMGIVRNSTAFPSPGLVMLQGPMAGNVYTAVLLAKDGLTYTATFQYVRSTKHFVVLTPVAAASSKVISVKLTPSEADENVYTADRDISEIKEALQAGHMALAYTPDAIGVYNSVSLITDCYRLASSASYLVTLLDCTQFGIVASHLITGEDGVTWTMDGMTEYAISGRVTDLENAMPHPVDKADAMTQAVGKAADGTLWTEPSGGSNLPITYLKSEDKTNPQELCKVNAGIYILYGYFTPYSGSGRNITYDNRLAICDVNTKDGTRYFQIFSPYKNTVLYLVVTESTYERTDTELSGIVTKIDTTLSNSSTYPLQNKVITEALTNLENRIAALEGEKST